MRWSRLVGRTVAALGLLAAAPPAYATINMTGRWLVDGTGPFGTFSDVWTFAQVGTALTQTPPSSGQPGPRTGSIDSTTGAFTLSDPVACQSPSGLVSCTVSGTVAPDGSTFTGTESCAAPAPPQIGCAGPFDFTLMGRLSPPTCGNGVVDPGEQCDNGMNLPGGCCNPACQFVAAGTPCGSSNCMASDTCDGTGTCVPGPPLGTCDQCSRCDAGSGICVADPATSCKAPTVAGTARLTVKHKGPALSWKWSKGQATTLADFGDPVHNDEYALCIYTEPAGTLSSTTATAGVGWRAAGQRGFTYKNKSSMVGDVTSIDLAAGVAGKAKIVVHAKPPVVPPLPVPLTVQLRSHGECWGASYVQAGVKKNTNSEFVANSSPSAAFLD